MHSTSAIYGPRIEPYGMEFWSIYDMKLLIASGMPCREFRGEILVHADTQLASLLDQSDAQEVLLR